MNRKTKNLCCLLLTAILCMGMSMSVFAKTTTKYDATLAAYQVFLQSNKGSYEIVDVDKNGVPELIIHNNTVFKNQMYTYDVKNAKMKCLINKDFGRFFSNEIMYSVKKHQIYVPFSDTQNNVYKIYKLNGKKLTLKYTFKSHSSPLSGQKYTINKKKVNYSSFRKNLQKRTKGFSSLKFSN